MDREVIFVLQVQLQSISSSNYLENGVAESLRNIFEEAIYLDAIVHVIGLGQHKWFVQPNVQERMELAKKENALAVDSSTTSSETQV